MRFDIFIIQLNARLLHLLIDIVTKLWQVNAVDIHQQVGSGEVFISNQCNTCPRPHNGSKDNSAQQLNIML